MPDATAVTTVPLTVQTEGVAELKVAGRNEVVVVLIVPVVPIVSLLG